jgi:hypothetical protein
MKSICGMVDGGLEEDDEKQQQQQQQHEQQLSMPPTAAKKSSRRGKKHHHQHVEIEEIDNELDKTGYATSCMSYASNYENRASGIPNYSTFPSSYLSPTTLTAQDSMMPFQSNYNGYYSTAATAVAARKHEQMLQSKFDDSPHSSIEEQQQQQPQNPPEHNVISSALATRSITPTSSTGTLRELSPSLITAHTVAKEDHITNECVYRNAANISEPNNKDLSLISKYNQESYRIYQHTQLHHHHHYHYAIGTPTQTSPNGTTSPNGSVGGGGSINYGAYQTYPSAIDDVDVDEMEQYLDNDKYRKFSYLKPENSSLTELSPLSASSSSSNAAHSLAENFSQHKHDENFSHIPSVEANAHAHQHSADVATAYTNYQNQVPSATATAVSSTATYPYIGNWVNYGI